MSNQEPDYSNVDHKKISSPAPLREYYDQCHRPVLQDMKAQTGGKVRAIIVPCGPCEEVKFFHDDPEIVECLGVDILDKFFEPALRAYPRMTFKQADVRRYCEPSDCMDIGIMVNGLVYHHVAMLHTLMTALRSGGKAVANVSIWEENQAYENVVRGRNVIVIPPGSGHDIQVTMPDGKQRTIGMTGNDVSQHVDETKRALGTQTFFHTLDDAVGLIEHSGLVIENVKPFSFEGSAGLVKNRVFTLRKP
jgi:hypothetical protein